MDRLACVDLPAFPLQLLCRRHPDWAQHPVVVVDEDTPQGRILWVNERARAARILPGHRYAGALALARDLRAGVVPEQEIAAGVGAVCEALRRFSPDVEPCADAPGVFWLDGAGLERLFRSLRHWARAVERALREQGYEAALAVGFTRFGTYAVARSRRLGVTLFDSPGDEHAAARDVSLELLGVDPRLRDHLRRLGVVTVGELLCLPAGGILERFGAEAHRLHRLARGDQWDPLRPTPAPEPLEERVLFDDPERDTGRLLFAVKSALDPLLERMARQRCALSRLFLELTLDRPSRAASDGPDGRPGGRASDWPNGRPDSRRALAPGAPPDARPATRGRRHPGRRSAAARHVDVDAPPGRGRRIDAIRPAEPTLDARTILRLLHLRLESDPPSSGVRELVLRADVVPATREQLELFAHRPRRDLRAANEALARLRAELGDRAVVKATVREGHLPEACFAWEPLREVALPRPAGDRPRRLIRRIWTRPRMLPPQEHRFRDDGWLLGSLEEGPVIRVLGPYIISGGWWAGDVHREYHFAETRRGDLLWVFYDRRRRRWFHHGRVE